jgi:hypothetical protein
MPKPKSPYPKPFPAFTADQEYRPGKVVVFNHGHWWFWARKKAFSNQHSAFSQQMAISK